MNFSLPNNIKELHIIFNDSNEEIINLLTETLKNTKTIMTKQEQMDAALMEIKTATDAIAARLQKLIDAGADNISQESLNALQADADALKAMGTIPPVV